MWQKHIIDICHAGNYGKGHIPTGCVPSVKNALKNFFSRYNPLYLITDTPLTGLTHSQIVKKAISAGITTVQLRDKSMTKRELYSEAVLVRNLTLKHKVKFIMNDHIDIAMAVRADGVHLGQDDMPIEEARRIIGKSMIIGISTHSLRQAIQAQDRGADYIGFGPMFKTSTKEAGRPKGLRSLKNVCSKAGIPVVAIGGISWENISNVMEAGADACAIVSAIQSGDIKANVKRLMKAL
jgi:thiamine-phosphate pyrophosphorylase